MADLVHFPMWGARSSLQLTLATWPAGRLRAKPKRNRLGQCPICKASNIQLTRDHWIPLSRGGRGLHNNIVWMCGPCNHTKGNSLPEEIGWERPL